MLLGKKPGKGKSQRIKQEKLNLLVNFFIFNNLVGAQIRRDNEKKHLEKIEYLLKINEEYLTKSDVIFIQAPGLNKTILVGDTRPLTSFKKKIINIPFNVHRANYTYMMEIFHKLIDCTLEVNDPNIRKLIKFN